MGAAAVAEPQPAERVPARRRLRWLRAVVVVAAMEMGFHKGCITIDGKRDFSGGLEV